MMLSKRVVLQRAAMGVVFSALLLGCGDDEESENGGPDTAFSGESCTTDEDCAMGLCQVFQDSPAANNSTCYAMPATGAMRITGTVRDLLTREPVPQATVRAVSALAALSTPTAASGLAEATTADDGRLAVTAGDVNGVPIGIVALAEKPGYYMTATGLAEPSEATAEYPAANTIHDLWVIPEAAITGWSEALMSDPAAADFVPLGSAGGIIGMVRDAESGTPVSGAVVTSDIGNGSEAVIRYLSEDGASFNTDQTGSSGLFVVLNPKVAEPFSAEANGVGYGPNLGGSAAGVVFAMTLE